MSKETPTLAASTRERTGSRYARRLRAAGQLPAVLYGHGMDPISIAIHEIEIIRHLTEGAHVFELDIEGRKETCLVKDLQFGWLGQGFYITYKTWHILTRQTNFACILQYE